MLKDLTLSERAYERLYAGSAVAVKFGGEFFEPEHFPALAEDVNRLRQSMHLLLVSGAGKQIDRHWERAHPGQKRTKINGVGVTTPEILHDAVLPAYEENGKRMAATFPGIRMVEPEQVVCDRAEPVNGVDVGLVGKVRTVNGIDLQHLSGVGSVGVDRKNADQKYNVNADDILRAVATQFGKRINEVVFMNTEGGVKDIDGAIVPLILSEDFDRILAGEHEKIKVSGGMEKKILEIQTMLRHRAISKIAVTGDLWGEIMHWEGSGTLCVDSESLKLRKLAPIEEEIFDAVYEDYVKRGIYPPLNTEGLRAMKKHHHVLGAKNSILGGFSLMRDGDDYLRMECLWSSYLQNGMSKKLIDGAKRLALHQGKKLCGDPMPQLDDAVEVGAR